MPSIFPQLGRSTWPQPQESIGAPLGYHKSSKMSCWEATGPALETYNQLVPDIKKTLSEKQGPVPNSDLIWFHLYMIGPGAEVALPHIMFACENKTARKKAKKIIKESGLLSKHPGMYVGEWAEPPVVGNQRLRGYNSSDDVIDDRCAASSPNQISVESFSTGNRKCVTLEFHWNGKKARATCGLGWELGDAEYWLTTAHVLFRSSSREAGHDGDDDGNDSSDASSTEYEFDGFAEDAAQQDFDIVGTSEGSSTTSASEDSDAKESVDSGSIDLQEPERVVQFIEATEDGSQQSTHAQIQTLDIAPQFISSEGSRESFLDYAVISAKLDYTLYKSPLEGPGKPNSDYGLQLLSPDLIVEPTRQRSRAQVHTSRGILTAEIQRTGTQVILPHSTEYQEVFVAYLSSPVLDGDSGAIVSDKKGMVYGHILSGSSTATAFVVPMSHIYKDIYLRSREIEQEHFGWNADLLTLDGHRGRVESVLISPNCQFVVSIWDDNAVRVWDLKSGKSKGKFHGHTERPYLFEISSDNKFVASASWDSVRIWNVQTGQAHCVYPSTRVGSVATSPGGQFVVLSPFDGSLEIRDVKRRKKKRVIRGLVDKRNSVAISPDCQYVVSTSDMSNTIHIWDIRTGLLRRHLKGHTDSIISAVVTSDSQSVVSASRDGTVRVWDLRNGSPPQILQGHTDRVKSVAISSDDRYVISASDDETVRVWDLKTGRQERMLQGFRKGVASVAISPDGHLVVATFEVTAAFEKKTASIWRECIVPAAR
ncbi:hypothetical protein G7054_g8628 [Neopestalotiopsis clavispora]|nr:hypothetical protein G7054_g8628 [Neopestalotiopsis clavispora]